jgi:hypothetical protein
VFRINEVISVEGIAYRILAEQLDEIVWISLDDEAAFPSVISRQVLLDAIDNEVLQRIEDPYAKLYYAQPDEGTKAGDLRDKNYQLIQPLISNPECMFPRARSRVVNQIIATQATTKKIFIGSSAVIGSGGRRRMLSYLTIKTPELRAKRGFQRVENLVVPDRR